jgi:hypothetical protein
VVEKGQLSVRKTLCVGMGGLVNPSDWEALCIISKGDIVDG